MLKHKSIDILKKMSEEEVRDFRKFINSSYFSKKSKLVKFFDIIKKFYPDFDDLRLTRENIYKKMFGQRKYNDSTIRNFLSELVKAEVRFMKIHNFEQKKAESQESLIDELRKKELGKLYKKNLDVSGKIIQEDANIGSYYYMNKYKYETDVVNYNLTYDEKTSPLKINDSYYNILARGENLIGFSIIDIIKQYITQKTFKINYKIQSSGDDITSVYLNNFNFEKFFSSLSKSQLTETNLLVLEIYYYLFKIYRVLDKKRTHKEESKLEDDYLKLKKLVLDNHNIFSKDEISFLCIRLIDFCILRSRKVCRYLDSDLDFDKELKELYLFYLRNEYYKKTVNDYLPVKNYRNIVTFGIRIKDFVWTEKFINEFKSKLHPKDLNDISNISHASLNFSRGIYGTANDFLSSVNSADPVIKVDTYTLRIRIFYELDFTDLVITTINNFRDYLKGNKFLQEENKNRYRNFCRYVRNLIQLKKKHFNNKLDKIAFDMERNHLEAENNTPYKNWLIEKYNELYIAYGYAG